MKQQSYNTETSSSVWPLLGAIFLGFIFCFSGISKVLFIYDFRGSVDIILVQILGRTTLSVGLIRDIVTISIPGIEFILGVSFFIFAKRPRIPAYCAAALLFLFTLILGVLLTMNRPPSCGCFGSWNILHASAKSGAVFGVVRNSGLMLLSLRLTRKSKQSNRYSPSPIGHHSSAQSGFTILELLVSIGIVAVLLALLLPALGKAKKQGIVARTLSAMRQCSNGITQYANEEADFLPYMGTPDHPEEGIWPDEDWGYWGAPEYFKGQSGLWPNTLLDHGIDLTGISPEVYDPTEVFAPYDTGPKRIATYYWLTNSAHARPEFWVGQDPPLDSSHLYRGVRMGEVVYPSHKGLLADVGHFVTDQPSENWAVAFFDGSVVLKATRNPSVYPDITRAGTSGYRVIVTEGGIRGRDY